MVDVEWFLKSGFCSFYVISSGVLLVFVCFVCDVLFVYRVVFVAAWFLAFLRNSAFLGTVAEVGEYQDVRWRRSYREKLRGSRNKLMGYICWVDIMAIKDPPQALRTAGRMRL